MSTNLPDFEKAVYVTETEPQLTPGHELIGASWSDQTPDGGFLTSILYGIIAAIIGSFLYAAFTIITHIEIGIVALFLGAFIAGAMMHPTGGVGGRPYQIAAAVLTYLSVSMAEIPEVLYHLHTQGTDLARISVRGYLILSAYAIVSPFLALTNFVSGAIGLFILYLGVRGAWKVAAGKRLNR